MSKTFMRATAFPCVCGRLLRPAGLPATQFPGSFPQVSGLCAWCAAFQTKFGHPPATRDEYAIANGLEVFTADQRLVHDVVHARFEGSDRALILDELGLALLEIPEEKVVS